MVMTTHKLNITSSLIDLIRVVRTFSLSHSSVNSFCFCLSKLKSFSSLLNLSLDALSVSFFKESFSISNFNIALSISSNSVGLEVISIFSFAAASSTRSMAKRKKINLAEETNQTENFFQTINNLKAFKSEGMRILHSSKRKFCIEVNPKINY